MTILVLKNSFMILSSDDEEFLDNIFTTLTFDDTSKAFNPYSGFDAEKIKKIKFSKYIEGLDLPSLKIPIGFEYFIRACLEDVEHQVIDDRIDIGDDKKIETKISLKDIKLHEHQVQAVIAAMKKRRGIIKSPTGSGKTEIFLSILSLLKAPSLVLFNRQQLTYQTMERAIKRGLDAGIVQGKNVLEKNITMATIQSIEKIERINKYKNLILDECFPAATQIQTEIGLISIKKIYDQKSQIKVWSYNFLEKKYELKKITNWHKKKYYQEFIKITLTNYKAKLICTKDHKIFLNNFNKKEAKNLRIGDRLILKPKECNGFGNGVCQSLTENQKSAVLGMLLGDSYLKKPKECKSKRKDLPKLKTTHGDKQKEYLLYKMSILKNVFSPELKITKSFSGYNPEKITWRSVSRASIDFLDFYKKIYINDRKSPINIVNQINDISLAFWIMDDGYLSKNNYYILSTQSFNKDEIFVLIKALSEKFSIFGKILKQNKNNKEMYKIRFTIPDSEKIAKLISPYIIPLMQYKLPEKYRNSFLNIDYYKNSQNFAELEIANIEYVSKNYRSVYDITVEDNHNYLIGDFGILVSNCHESTSKSYQEILKLNHWERIYGFSATPIHPTKFTLKTAKIIANVGPIILDIEPKPLIEKQIIAKPKIIFVPVDQPEDIEEFSYQEAEKVAIVNNPYRHKLVKRIADYHNGEKILILTKYIDQGEQIADILKSTFISHKNKLKERIEILNEFDNGKKDILVASRILDQGIDIINFTVLIIASSGKSFSKTIQRLGRGFRTSKTKKNVTVYDFYDSMHPSLLRHSQNRKRDYVLFGYDDITIIKESSDLDLYFI